MGGESARPLPTMCSSSMVLRATSPSSSTRPWRGYNPEAGAFHLGGVSNGGRSTFRILAENPDRFASVTVFPGFAEPGADTDALAAVTDLPFTLWVGGADVPWIAPMEATRDALTALGATVRYEVFEGAPHVIPELTDGIEIFDALDAARP